MDTSFIGEKLCCFKKDQVGHTVEYIGIDLTQCPSVRTRIDPPVFNRKKELEGDLYVSTL